MGKVKRSDPNRVIAHRLVRDPYMSDAEFFEQRRVKSGPNVGKVVVAMNLVEMIGGLARIEDRTELQEEAARKFRLIYERAQIGGSKAIDYAAVKVDTSGPSAAAVRDIGGDARAQYSAAVQHLGVIRSSLVEKVVVHDMSISAVAGRSGQQMKLAKNMLMASLDALAVHFRLASKRAA